MTKSTNRNIEYKHFLRFAEIYSLCDEEIDGYFKDLFYSIYEDTLFIKLIDQPSGAENDAQISLEGKHKSTDIVLFDFLLEYLTDQGNFFGKPVYVSSNVFSKVQFDNIYKEALRLGEEEKQLAIQLYSGSEIIKYCKSIELNPYPTGGNPNNWEACCPSGASHSFMISPKSNEWGCGYCKKKGDMNLLKEWYLNIHWINNDATDLNYTREREEWKKMFENLSDKELVETFNRGVGIAAWGYGRAAYVSCLRIEFEKRSFDSTILFGEDINGYGKSFLLGNKVQLIKGKLYREVDLQDQDIKAEINKDSKNRHQKMLSKIVKIGYDNLSESEKAYWNSVY